MLSNASISASYYVCTFYVIQKYFFLLQVWKYSVLSLKKYSLGFLIWDINLPEIYFIFVCE